MPHLHPHASSPPLLCPSSSLVRTDLSSDSSSATLTREEVHSFEQRRRLDIPRLGILMSDEMAYALALADKTRRSELIDQLRQLDVFSRLTDVRGSPFCGMRSCVLQWRGGSGTGRRAHETAWVMKRRTPPHNRMPHHHTSRALHHQNTTHNTTRSWGAEGGSLLGGGGLVRVLG